MSDPVRTVFTVTDSAVMIGAAADDAGFVDAFVVAAHEGIPLRIVGDLTLDRVHALDALAHGYDYIVWWQFPLLAAVQAEMHVYDPELDVPTDLDPTGPDLVPVDEVVVAYA